MTLAIDRAGLADAGDVAPLFDAYRRFHGGAGDLDLARSFIGARLRLSESTIFLARIAGEPVGFTQLYPSFTSLVAARSLILNDLYVAPQAEGRGVGRALLQAAADFARSVGAVRLTLMTGVGNRRAQALYERTGWVRNDAYLSYHRSLESPARA